MQRDPATRTRSVPPIKGGKRETCAAGDVRETKGNEGKQGNVPTVTTSGNVNVGDLTKEGEKVSFPTEAKFGGSGNAKSARPYTLQPHELRAQVRAERAKGFDSLPAAERPQTRAECAQGVRPCPWLGCRYHLWLDVHPDAGSIKVNQPDALAWIESDDPSIPAPTCESCALDVADRGGHLLEEVGDMVGLCNERVRQIELRMLRELRVVQWEVTW